MDAEQQFLQFQQTREPAHLGAVFDLAADDLFAFALHLVTDGTFAIGPLAIDQRYSVRIEPEGFAPATVGPFDATVRRQEVTVRMQSFGSVLCVVLRPDGRPAANAHVGLEHADGDHPFERAYQGDTDQDGRLRLDRVPPDDFNVYAAAEASPGGKARGSVTVRPGQQASVQLTLGK